MTPLKKTNNLDQIVHDLKIETNALMLLIRSTQLDQEFIYVGDKVRIIPPIHDKKYHQQLIGTVKKASEGYYLLDSKEGEIVALKDALERVEQTSRNRKLELKFLRYKSKDTHSAKY